jgi:hypothetical protein
MENSFSIDHTMFQSLLSKPPRERETEKVALTAIRGKILIDLNALMKQHLATLKPQVIPPI